jgi:hypothetical protein
MPPIIKNTVPPEPNASVMPEEFKDPALKSNVSKFDYDLYKEEDNIAEKVIRVKRSPMPNKGEKWRIMEDNKVVFTIESTKLTRAQRAYLQTVEGFTFLLSQAKIGIKSFHAFKLALKSMLTKNSPPKPRAKTKPRKKGK